MAQYTISNQHRRVHLLYRCSNCDNPVVINSNIFSVVMVSASMFNGTTVEDAAAFVMDHLEDEINKCCARKTALGESVITKTELINRLKIINISPSGSSFNSQIDGYSAGSAWLLMDNPVACPICGNIEEWQRTKAKAEDLERLDEDCFPKVYHSNELAELFAKLKLQKKHEGIMEARLVPGTVDKAKKSYQEKTLRQREIEAELNCGDTHDQIDSIVGDLHDLEEQLKHVKAFDFTSKKALGQQIKEKKLEISSLKERQRKHTNSLKQEALQIERDLEDLAYLTQGTNGNAEIVISSGAIAYRLLTVDKEANGDKETESISPSPQQKKGRHFMPAHF